MDLNKILFGPFESVFGKSNVVPFVPHDKRNEAGRLARERAVSLGYRSKTVLDACERSAKRAANRRDSAEKTAREIVGHPQESAVVPHGLDAA